MLLAIDVGNTQTVIGAYRGEELVHHWRTSTNTKITGDELALYYQGFLLLKGLTFPDFDGVIISSVVPSATMALLHMVRDIWGFEPLVVGQNVRIDMPLLIDNPGELGADRIVNAVAAFERYGGPSISARGEYLGGAIAPGIEISSIALFNAAARLPRVELKRPEGPIGRNSVASMQSGIVFGFAGQVERLVEMMKAELGEGTKIIATGGLAEVVVGECRCIDVHDPLLTLHGLWLLYRSNRPGAID
jgi:type III pantothenate kinase